MKINSTLNIFIFGRGKLSRQLHIYINSRSFKTTSVTRDAQPLAVPDQIAFSKPISEVAYLEKDFESSASLLLLASSDDKNAEFSRQVASQFPNLPQIHFSGLLDLPHAMAAHPLWSFQGVTMSPPEFEKIPLVLFRTDTDKQTSHVEQLKAIFKNPIFLIPVEKRAEYYSLLVLGGNLSAYLTFFTKRLWMESFPDLNAHFDAYISGQISASLDVECDPKLSGPYLRGETKLMQSLEMAFPEEIRSPAASLAKALVKQILKNTAAISKSNPCQTQMQVIK